jgi:hypothetical protein
MMRASRVRPYAITGGRTRPDHDLTNHTRLTVPNHDPARAADLQPEAQAIYEQLHQRQPSTVADLAACLRAIPDTTLLVLLSDLITDGLVAIDPDDQVTSSKDMLGRILNGLRELSP